MKKCNYSVSLRVLCDTGKHTCITQKFRYSRMPRHSCCEVRVMQLHDILLLRTSASLHSVSVGAKPLSTGQCAPRRRLFLSQDAIFCERKTPQSRKILRSAVLTVFKLAVHAAVCSRMPRQSCCKMEATSHLILPYRYFFSSSTLSSLSQGRSRSLRPK